VRIAKIAKISFRELTDRIVAVLAIPAIVAIRAIPAILLIPAILAILAIPAILIH